MLSHVGLRMYTYTNPFISACDSNDVTLETVFVYVVSELESEREQQTCVHVYATSLGFLHISLYCVVCLPPAMLFS